MNLRHPALSISPYNTHNKILHIIERKLQSCGKIFFIPPSKYNSFLWQLMVWPVIWSFKMLFLGGAPTSMCHFFRPSICLSVAHHISETVYHLIISFGTHE